MNEFRRNEFKKKNTEYRTNSKSRNVKNWHKEGRGKSPPISEKIHKKQRKKKEQKKKQEKEKEKENDPSFFLFRKESQD